jgi:hypothetical protein
MAQLHDQLGQVRLHGGDALRLQCVLEVDLLGGHGLDLDDLVHALGLHEPGDDPVGLLGVPGPVDDAAARGDPLLELLEQGGQVRHHLLLQGGAGLAQLGPVRQLPHHACALAADGVGGVVDVGAHLGVAQLGAGRGGEGLVQDDVAVAVRGADGGHAQGRAGHRVASF